MGAKVGTAALTTLHASSKRGRLEPRTAPGKKSSDNHCDQNSWEVLPCLHVPPPPPPVSMLSFNSESRLTHYFPWGIQHGTAGWEK